MLQHLIWGNSQTGIEIHLLSIIASLNILRYNIIYKKEQSLKKLTKNYYISANLNDSQQQMSIYVCPFGLCCWVKCSCNISNNQNTT